MSLLIELHYLPSLEYFCALLPQSAVVIEKHEHFVKQSYRNRCYINTTQGVEMLTVPLTGKHGKVSIAEVRVDNGQKWQNNHWRTIESAYRNAPYYEHYAEGLRKIIYKPHSYLFDLNLELLSFCLASLKWETNISFTGAYQAEYPLAINDLRDIISPKKPYTERNLYRPAPYYQVFGSTFAENLSLVDLLFCAGPQATQILRQSRTNN